MPPTSPGPTHRHGVRSGDERYAGRVIRGSLALRLKNLAASSLVVAFACAAYSFVPNNKPQLDAIYSIAGYGFTGRNFLFISAFAYAVLLAIFYSSEHRPRVSKSLRFLLLAARFVRYPLLIWRRGIDRGERLAVLATALKAFFGPMMIMSLMIFSSRAIDNAAALLSSAPSVDFRTVFDRFGFWFLLQVILLIDVSIFTIGYLVELPRLRNEIRSVDPTLLGWGAALICYPPFNKIAGAILGSQVTDFPQFDNPTTHIVLNVALLALLATYASASVALGFKGSNLTHRGVVSRGPYAVVRHPAYTSKNLAWWIASIPLVSAAFGHSTFSGIQAIASVIGWSMIYVLRALTEEDHLRSVDGEYAAYANKVSYRFIPGVI